MVLNKKPTEFLLLELHPDVDFNYEIGIKKMITRRIHGAVSAGIGVLGTRFKRPYGRCFNKKAAMTSPERNPPRCVN